MRIILQYCNELCCPSATASMSSLRLFSFELTGSKNLHNYDHYHPPSDLITVVNLKEIGLTVI